MSLRNKILSVSDLKSDSLIVPEWEGVLITVRAMTVRERTEFADTAKRDLAAASVQAVIACTSDPESGKPLFEPADRDVLLARNAKPVDDILAVVFRLSGIGKEAEKALEKN